MRATTNSGRSRLLLAVTVAMLIGAVVLAPTGGAGTPPAGAQEPNFTVEVTPHENVVDGQTLRVVVRAAAGHRLGDSGIVRACRDGATYQSLDDVNPFTAGNCPDRPVSSSASQPWPIRSYPDGSVAVTTFHAGTGTVEWGPEVDPTRFSLTCDAANPCRLVIALSLDGRDFFDSSTLLTYTNENPIGACGGSEADAITTGGPDRLSGAWVALTRAKCVSEGSRVSTLAVLAGEGDGQDAFAQGRADLTYSAVGPAFPGTSPTVTRPSVSVPVALNATVIGVLGGYGSTAADWPKGVPKPYQDLKVTMAEMATLFGQGRYLFDAYYLDAVQSRNPELAGALGLTNNDRGNPIAPAGAEAVTWTATSAFDTLAADQWKSPPQAIDGNVPNAPRGVHDSLALADPPFTFSLFELYSAQGQIKRLVADFELRPFSYGPIWVLTDLATARQFGIPTVALQNSSGEFVQPTDASLQAAVPSLELQPDGTYLPGVGADVTGGASLAADAPGAYPLTFVEHAVAPTEPLVDDACAPRSGSQQLMANWLAYLTGPGQAELPDGLVALPPALVAQATTARALVGATAVTGDCAPAGPTDPGVPPAPESVDPPGGPGLPSGTDFTTGGGSGLPGGAPGGSSVGGGAFGAGSGSGALGDGAGGLPTDELAAGSDDGDMNVAEISYPGPAGGSSGNGLATGLAIVALAVLVAVGGALSTGKRPHLRRGGTP